MYTTFFGSRRQFGPLKVLGKTINKVGLAMNSALNKTEITTPRGCHDKPVLRVVYLLTAFIGFLVAGTVVTGAVIFALQFLMSF